MFDLTSILGAFDTRNRQGCFHRRKGVPWLLVAFLEFDVSKKERIYIAFGYASRTTSIALPVFLRDGFICSITEGDSFFRSLKGSLLS